MTITQITHNIGNYIINTDMNITIDKENKRITLHEEITIDEFNALLRKEDMSMTELVRYKIAPPPKEIQYIPYYPIQPIIPQIVPYPVYPHPYPPPPPNPNIPYWTITCKL